MSRSAGFFCPKCTISLCVPSRCNLGGGSYQLLITLSLVSTHKHVRLQAKEHQNNPNGEEIHFHQCIRDVGCWLSRTAGIGRETQVWWPVRIDVHSIDHSSFALLADTIKIVGISHQLRIYDFASCRAGQFISFKETLRRSKSRQVNSTRLQQLTGC